MFIQFLNMLSFGTTTATNCSNGLGNSHLNNQLSSSLNVNGSSNGGSGGECGDKPSLSLSLSNNSSPSSSTSSSVTGGDGGYSLCESGFNGQTILSKLHQQDAATSPTIPLLSTLLYDCNSSMFFSTNNSSDDINTNCITPIGCSSPIINRTSPQFNNNGFDLNNNSVNNSFNNLIISKNTNNQRLTNSGGGAIKQLLIKSNCRPSDLVCSLKSPSNCLACYANCSTCSNNNSSKSTAVNYDCNSKTNYNRLMSNHNSSIRRTNDPGLRIGSKGIKSNNHLTGSVNGLGYVNGYGSMNGNGTGPTTTIGGKSTTTTNNVISSTFSQSSSNQSHVSTTTTTTTGGNVVMVSGGGITSTGGGGINSRGSGMTIPPISISPTGYDEYHLSSPTNSRTYDKFDNFNSNIFNDHCSAISAPLSSYYLDEPKHHSCFRKSIPTMPIALSAFLLLLNCFLPGSGTILSSITILFGCSTEYGKGKWKRAFLLTLIAGILQFLTAIFVFGWVWSIMTGINFIKHSNKMKDSKFGYGDAL